MNKTYFIGLMSGTSMDAIDAVLVKFNGDIPTLIASHQEPMTEKVFKDLNKLCLPDHDEINRLGQIDRTTGKLFATAVNKLLTFSGVKKEQVIAIGSHGQTIRHMPNLNMGFTLQVGDPNTIATETGIDVIADFRGKDIALGGQGAPLVPAFHQYVFSKPQQKRIILNIGGIANITFLPGNEHQVLGFDTGPGNTLMDAWIQRIKQEPYDKSGLWAATGTTDTQMLNQLLSHPYFSLSSPKSTGRELFSYAWLEQQLSNFTHLEEADIQSTLLDLTCHSIAKDILTLSPSGELFVCGGGAYNTHLMKQLAQQLPKYQIHTTEKLGISPQWVESIAFAWLAMRYEYALPGNLPSVTGASRTTILGGKYCAN
ncbi:anhydro-N-acetylmuramic acid kinase [uncultured Shewanella sp.]|uniref:anhydro-N-acetylmuramic acid kinase n=1 Tax=uncultured Shewanella sp. TaxID=173975 RepID=UPI002618A13A|nr:anhydro-N-acetylmuramic acid kinase [uncultured Shewanella sp.]